MNPALAQVGPPT